MKQFSSIIRAVNSANVRRPWWDKEKNIGVNLLSKCGMGTLLNEGRKRWTISKYSLPYRLDDQLAHSMREHGEDNSMKGPAHNRRWRNSLYLHEDVD
jgi:hypothetical protein